MGGKDVRVSYPRLTQYSSLCDKQDGYLSSVDAMVSGSCANFGAFTGFMALFKGAYEDAQQTVAGSMDEARKAAQDASAAFDAVKAELKKTDGLVRGDLAKVTVEVEAPGAYDGPGDVNTPGGVPGPIKYGNGALGTMADATDAMAGGTNSVDHPIRGLPTDGINLVADGTDTITTGIEMGETEDDINDYEDFEDKHGAKR